jgi:hypothetical protein
MASEAVRGYFSPLVQLRRWWISPPEAPPLLASIDSFRIILRIIMKTDSDSDSEDSTNGDNSKRETTDEPDETTDEPDDR